MSKTHLLPFKDINRLVEKHREEGLKLLFIFKAVKNAVIKERKKDSPEMKWLNQDDELNKVCIEVAKEIQNECGDYPTEEEIRQVISNLKNRYR